MINGDKILGRNQHCMAFVKGARQPAGATPSFRSSYRNAFAIVLALLGLGGFAHADALGMPAVGIHLIPDYYNEIYIGAPPYQVRTIKQPADGFADLPFFLVKTRLGSGNEENGDYVVTAFLSGQAPIGIKPFTANAY
jgi:hypothetical protein